MSISRRQLALLLPAMAAAQSVPAQERLASGVFRFEDLPETVGATTRIRNMFKGRTHTGFLIDLHVTELAPGQQPHAPHHHLNEEVLMIREGTLDVTIAGKTTRLGPGSAAYFASNVEHGWRNAGTAPARYFDIALGETTA